MVPGILVGLALACGFDDATGADLGRLTSRPRPVATAVKPVPVGREIRTGAGRRERAVLADGSILYVNQNTAVKVDAERQVTLAAGEVFVEAAPAATPLVVNTPRRAVSAGAARFVLRVGTEGTSVVVARGEVRVAGLAEPVAAGQQLAAGAERPGPAPRPSHMVGWVKDLMVAAEPPLVPASRHAGGALTALDAEGQEAHISLRKYHLDVHIEDGFARTTIDQTYFNHELSRLEGTFYFPLPADASLSRLAMYADGRLMEGGMAERDHARQVYETIRYQQRDPALLEWLDGSTFKMRVFPLEGRQEKRIILSYTQRLPGSYDRAEYRFPAGHSLQQADGWSFHARVKGGAGWTWASPSHTLRATHDGADLLLDAAARDARTDQDVTLTLDDPAAGAGPAERVRFSSALHDGARYLMLRYRPALPPPDRPEAKPGTPRHWVILFESSGDRDPLLARAQVELVRGLLGNVAPEDTFVVLAAGTRPHVFDPTPRPATPADVQAAVAFLEGAHLIGALDLGRALAAAEPLLRAAPATTLVHVGSGIAALGERRADVLLRHLPAGARYVGIGVGNRWDRAFMKRAAEQTDGYFTQINPDEPITWRAFELAATLAAPRLLHVQVEDTNGRARFLTETTALAQGEELCAVARLGPDEKDVPESVTVSGTLAGEPVRVAVPVRDAADGADYVPRTWARLEIDRLLAEDATKNKDRIVALSKAMYVVTPFTSLLVLESEDMYQQYKVDRGRKDHWAMYPCPEKIPVATESDPAHPAGIVPAKKPRADEVLPTVAVRGEAAIQPFASTTISRPRASSPASRPPARTRRSSGTRSTRTPGRGRHTCARSQRNS